MGLYGQSETRLLFLVAFLMFLLRSAQPADDFLAVGGDGVNRYFVPVVVEDLPANGHPVLLSVVKTDGSSFPAGDEPLSLSATSSSVGDQRIPPTGTIALTPTNKAGECKIRTTFSQDYDPFGVVVKKSTADKFVVVGVGKIEKYAEAQQVDGDQTEVYLKGSRATFRAKKDPPTAAEWPSGMPVWSCSGITTSGEDGIIEGSVIAHFDSEGDDKTLTASCGTSSKTTTFDVIVPQIDYLRFTSGGGGSQYDIAGKSNKWQASRPGQTAANDPGCFKQGAKTAVKVSFYHSKPLTFATDVRVWGNVHWFDEYITGGDYVSTDMTFGTSWPTPGDTVVVSSGNAEAAIKDDYDVDVSWEYQWKAPEGVPVDWIDAGSTNNLRIYLIWDDPLRPAGEWKDNRFAFLADLAEGKASVSDIGDVLGPDLTGPARFDIRTYLPGTTAWRVIDENKDADCGSICTAMKLSLDLLGLSGAEVRYVYPQYDDWAGLWSTSSNWRTNAENRDGTEYTRLGFYNGPTQWNNYEGCCFFDGKWWLGGPGESRTSAYEVLMAVTYPNTNGNCRQAYVDAPAPAPAVDYAPPPPP